MGQLIDFVSYLEKRIQSDVTINNFENNLALNFALNPFPISWNVVQSWILVN